jgi:hypothetical protein
LPYEKNKDVLGTYFRRVENGCAVPWGFRLEHGKRFSHTKAKAKNAPRHEAGEQAQRPALRYRSPPSSFIRTMTVGSGIRPDLLTLRQRPEALAGSSLLKPPN